jgi:hypothetical protein
MLPTRQITAKAYKRPQVLYTSLVPELFHQCILCNRPLQAAAAPAVALAQSYPLGSSRATAMLQSLLIRRQDSGNVIGPIP